MTTNDDMTPRQPDEGEPLEDLLGDEIDRVDQAVARITDAEVNERLRKALSRAAFAGQSPAQWPRPIESSVMAELICQTGPAMAPEHAAVADLLATARANARLSGQRLRRADEVLGAAHQQAEEIVTAAREEAAEALDEALKEAAKIVRAARERAERIIGDARHEAGLVITAARNPQPDRPQPCRMVIAFDGFDAKRDYSGRGIPAEDTVAAATGLVASGAPPHGEEQDHWPHLRVLFVGPRNYDPQYREGVIGAQADDTLAETDSSNCWRASYGLAPASEGLPSVLAKIRAIYGRISAEGPLTALWDTGRLEDRGDRVQMRIIGGLRFIETEIPTVQRLTALWDVGRLEDPGVGVRIIGPPEIFPVLDIDPAGHVPRW